MTTVTRSRDELSSPSAGPQEPAAHGAGAIDLQASVDGILNRWPAVGFAVGVVRGGRLEAFHGHGMADVATNTPITEDTVFRIASITKTFTAVAVMQLWEQGLVDLDAPANDYLRAFRLTPVRVGVRPATVRHLLTHTAGVPEVLRPADLLRPDWGDSVRLGDPIPSLADFYRGSIRLDAEPGTRFAYTNHGFAVLQQIVEDVSGKRFDRYLREHILEPLGMADSSIVRSEVDASRLATGYTIGAHGAKAVVDREWVTPGASSIYSTIRDMSRYVAAILGGGTNQHGTILRPETLAMMFEPQYQPHPLVPGMGLGFDRGLAGGHRVVGHGGILPGFNSQLFAYPDDGVGVVGFTTGARRAMLWLPTELGRLMNRVLGIEDDAVRHDVPHHPEAWGELCGWYRNPARFTDIRSQLMLGAGAEVVAGGDRLRLRLLSPVPALYRGFELHPDDPADPDVFRIDLGEFGLPPARIVFSHEAERPAAAVHVDIFPASLLRAPATTNPRRWAKGVLVGLGAAIAAVIIGRRRSSPPSGRRSAVPDGR